ncbi:hypothetical protein AB5J52_48565 (plasmid) [Streptomyces sp. R39]|uniref:JAB domain-containing protein n=1 Tax=Streptomyces sp. R39 TaxID=3238631 RepID=A0AB39R5Z9_9ACTN
MTTADLTPVTALIAEREQWLLKRGKHSYGQGAAVLGLIGQPVQSSTVIGLFRQEDGHVLGCSVLLTAASAVPGWTAAELRERTWVVTMSHSHPAFSSDPIGWLMTMWVGDYAARQPDPPAWLRCRVPAVLVAHYRDQLGWQLVRTRHDREVGSVSLMQRRPESSHGAPALITSLIPVEAS